LRLRKNCVSTSLTDRVVLLNLSGQIEAAVEQLLRGGAPLPLLTPARFCGASPIT
jgi:hypothetical protein